MTVINFYRVLAYFLINAITLVKSSISPETLQLVHMMYRHGDRSPIHTFPTNPVPVSAWPQGLGQLTQLGIRQHFALGRYMRRYYDGFLNKTYDRDEIVIRSTDKDRTLMSAQAHLSGLYVPTGYEVWNSSILWQPIPVHTVTLETDNLLSMDPYCPRFEEMFNKIADTPRVKKFIEKNQPFYAELSRKTGMEVNFTNAHQINDTLFCQRLHHFPEPDWVKNTTEQLHQVSAFYVLLLYANNKTVRLKGGSLLKAVTDNMLNRMKGLLSTPTKMFMYSTHDDTLMSFLQTLLDYTTPHQPPYTATVLVELHRDADGKYFVMLLYKNSSSDPRLLTIRGCSERCPLSKFIAVTNRYACQDWRKECGLDDTVTPRVSRVVYILGGLVAAVLLFAVLAIVIAVTRHVHRRKRLLLYGIVDSEGDE